MFDDYYGSTNKYFGTLPTINKHNKWQSTVALQIDADEEVQVFLSILQW